MTNTLQNKEPLSFPYQKHSHLFKMVLPSLIQFYLYLNGIIQIPKLLLMETNANMQAIKHSHY